MDEAQDPFAQLKDIHLPADPSVWPLAWGWWLLIVALFLLLLGALVLMLRQQRQRRFRRSVVAMLHDIELPHGEQDTPRYLSEVSVLLRRVAVHSYPRMDVASLSGENWLRFLDEKGKTRRFTEGVGQALSDGPYRLSTTAEAEGLRQLAQQWIRKNLDVSS